MHSNPGALEDGVLTPYLPPYPHPTFPACNIRLDVGNKKGPGSQQWAAQSLVP